ncbi:MAG TPA: hypothetical protein VF060_19905 [Trebonia sp.]
MSDQAAAGGAAWRRGARGDARVARVQADAWVARVRADAAAARIRAVARVRAGAGGARVRAARTWEPPNARRWLQLALGAVWLLDAELQYQAFMFTKGFGQMLAATAPGNPAVIAGPIIWSARIIEAHPGPVNAAFATIQLLLGLGIIWRPAVKAALAASVVWSVAVWWLGEGLGGVLAGTASPLSGAPGAVILYGLLAVLLWPVSQPVPVGKSGPAGMSRLQAPFEAARAVGAGAARLLWLVLWGSLAWFAVGPAASRAAQGPHDMISAMASGEPGWLAAIDDGAARLLAGNGLPAAVVLAVLFTLIAVGIYAPRPAARAAVVTAIVAAAAIWVAGQDLGGVFTGSSTDPQSGLLLMMLAAAYWPRRLADVSPAPEISPALTSGDSLTAGATAPAEGR